MRRGRAQPPGVPTQPQPDEVGLGLPVGGVALVGWGEPSPVGVGECAVGPGLGDVGEAVGRVGDGLGDVGEGLARRVVGEGVGVGVRVCVAGGGDTDVPSCEDDPFVAGGGRTSR